GTRARGQIPRPVAVAGEQNPAPPQGPELGREELQEVGVVAAHAHLHAVRAAGVAVDQPGRAATCSTAHGLSAHGAVVATSRNDAHGTHRQSATSSGSGAGEGSGGPSRWAKNTGQSSCSTIPSAATARWRKTGRTNFRGSGWT